MKNNLELQREVQNAIMWEPLMHATEIGVIVQGGVVVLTGVVDSYAKKLVAEKAARGVTGVKALVEKIEVQIPSAWNKTNTEIAVEVLNALNSNVMLPKDQVTVKVEDGWVTLGGTLIWNYQIEAAKNAVHYLMGVKGVINNIEIKTETNNAIEQKEVEKALALSWAVNGCDIRVKVSGTKIILNGTVNSWYQKEEAARIAWNTKGIRQVENDLEVDYRYVFIS